MSPTSRPCGGEDVALLAVEVVQQRDARVAVRVVLDRRDLRGHAVLVPLEVDEAVALLVTAAAVTRRHAAVRVATTGLRLRLRERLLGLGLRDLGEVGGRLEPAPRARRLALANGHRQLPKMSMRSSPAARVTMARFWRRGALPTRPVRRLRLRLPLRLMVCTFSTRLPKSSSTALRISILLASGATTNV